MSDQELLKQSCRLLAGRYRDLTPEAVISYMIVADSSVVAVRYLASMLQIPEARLMVHLSLLIENVGAGLVHLSGGNITLTEKGMQLKQELGYNLTGNG